MNNKQQSYFITATIENKNNKKIYISASDLKRAFEVEHELLNYKTMEIYNIRKSKYKPKSKKGYIEIKSIEDIES